MILFFQRKNHTTSSPNNLEFLYFLPKKNLFSLSKTNSTCLEKGSPFTLPFPSSSPPSFLPSSLSSPSIHRRRYNRSRHLLFTSPNQILPSNLFVSSTKKISKLLLVLSTKKTGKPLPSLAPLTKKIGNPLSSLAPSTEKPTLVPLLLLQRPSASLLK